MIYGIQLEGKTEKEDGEGRKTNKDRGHHVSVWHFLVRQKTFMTSSTQTLFLDANESPLSKALLTN